jgi:hypothetical protein
LLEVSRLTATGADGAIDKEPWRAAAQLQALGGAIPSMKCRLCLQERQLCDSHIIPELLYRPLYGRSHQLRSVDPALPYVRFPRKGLREKLLCVDCETRLSQYESGFAESWFGEQGLPTEIPAPANMIMKSGLDYQTFKLFHLSILWRAGVSSMLEFRAVKLGLHAERMRQMILAGNPGDVRTYRLAASVLLRPGLREVHSGVVGVPARQRHDGGYCYSTIYAGCIWHCIVSDNVSTNIDTLTADGCLGMVVMDIRNIPTASKALARAAVARRGP